MAPPSATSRPVAPPPARTGESAPSRWTSPGDMSALAASGTLGSTVRQISMSARMVSQSLLVVAHFLSSLPLPSLSLSLPPSPPPSLSGPCQFGGTCTNTEGSFMCECPSGYKGHRCQYTTVCNDAQDRCPGNQTCVETISNTQGFVCADATSTGAVVVMGITSGPGHLDDQVNNIQEVELATT